MKIELALAYMNSFIGSNGKETGIPNLEGQTVKTVTRYVSGIGSQVTARNGVILEAGTKKEFGITNFENGNVLGANEYLMVTGIRLLIDKKADVTPKTAVWGDVAPAPWLNGEIVISDEDGRLFESSITDVHNFKASASNDDDFRTITPILIRAEKRFELQALLAGAGAGEAFKLELRCIQFKR